MNADSTATLEGTALSCIRGERLVFENLSFSLNAGSSLRLTGPNGSGKTTLLRLLAGLSRPEAGTVAWVGTDISHDMDAHRRRTAWLGHGDAVKPWMTVAENVRFWTGLRGRPDGAADTALERVALGGLADLPAQILSAGQRRRLALARVFASGTDLWLLDEPTVGLDTPSRGGLESALADHCAAGGLAIVATHQPVALPGETALDLALAKAS